MNNRKTKFSEFASQYMPMIGEMGRFISTNKDAGTEQLVTGALGIMNRGVEGNLRKEFWDWYYAEDDDPNAQLTPRAKKWAEDNGYTRQIRSRLKRDLPDGASDLKRDLPDGASYYDEYSDRFGFKGGRPGYRRVLPNPRGKTDGSGY